MGRPIKLTVEYFSHDAAASQGRTLTIIENHFGAEGYATWWKLLEALARTRNHVIGVGNPEDVEFLAAGMHLSPERLQAILQKLAELDAIDRELFGAGVIWSQNFVDRLGPVYKSRGQAPPARPANSGVSLPDNGVASPSNPVSSRDNAPKKEREKAKRLEKEKNKLPYGRFGNIFLTVEELANLEAQFGTAAQQRIDALSEYVESRGTKYRSHFATILSWARRDGQNSGRSQSGGPMRRAQPDRVATEWPPDRDYGEQSKSHGQDHAKGASDGQERSPRPIPGNEPSGAFSDYEKV